jgi:hypothetical protein
MRAFKTKVRVTVAVSPSKLIPLLVFVSGSEKPGTVGANDQKFSPFF